MAVQAPRKRDLACPACRKSAARAEPKIRRALDTIGKRPSGTALRRRRRRRRTPCPPDAGQALCGGLDGNACRGDARPRPNAVPFMSLTGSKAGLRPILSLREGKWGLCVKSGIALRGAAARDGVCLHCRSSPGSHFFSFPPDMFSCRARMPSARAAQVRASRSRRGGLMALGRRKSGSARFTRTFRGEITRPPASRGRIIMSAMNAAQDAGRPPSGCLPCRIPLCGFPACANFAGRAVFPRRSRQSPPSG
jgi:hypothetical protein